MLVAIGAFLFVASLAYAVGRFLTGGRNPNDQVFAGGRRRPTIFGPLTTALARIIPFGSYAKKKVTQDLRRAGYYHHRAFDEFASLRNVLLCGIAFLLIVVFAVVIEPGSVWTLRILIVGAVLMIMAYSLPRLMLHSQAAARVQRIEYALPDALDMITMCMTGGLPLQHAMTRVSDELGETHPDLAYELRIVGRQMNAGSFDGAVRQFAERIDTPNVQSLANVVNLADRQGTNVGAAFQEYADGVRRMHRQRAEERGNKASVKMMLPLVFCLAPPVYILLLAPAAMELKTFVTQENRPGGVLSPTSVTADGEVLSGSQLESLSDADEASN